MTPYTSWAIFVKIANNLYTSYYKRIFQKFKIELKIFLKHSESPSSGEVMSFNAKKTTHFDKLDIFGFFNDLIKKMVKI